MYFNYIINYLMYSEYSYIYLLKKWVISYEWLELWDVIFSCIFLMLLRDEFLCFVLCGVYSNLIFFIELCKVNVILRLF